MAPNHVSLQSVSILVPTRNRAQSLERLLASLERCRCPQSAHVDVVVVNNASTDNTHSRLDALMREPRRYPLKVVESAVAGKARALNLGCTQSSGDIIMIFDDDVVVHENCVSAHLDAYRDMSVDAVQGKILPGDVLGGGAVAMADLWQYNIPFLDHGEEPCQLRGLTGTNMSFRRTVFETIGGFDVRLGPGSAGFSEDTEFSRRLRRAGLLIGYTPKAIVHHELDPSRKGRAYCRQVQYRKGISRSIYRQDLSCIKPIFNLLTNTMRLLGYTILGRHDKRMKTEGRIMKDWGYLSGRMFPRRVDRP